MSSIVVSGDTSGAITLQAPLVAGTNTITIPAATGVMALTSQVPNGLTSGTAVASTSGTSFDFTSIPSWVKRITVACKDVQTNGTSHKLVQIGAGSIVTSGYTSYGGAVSSGGIGYVGSSAGIIVYSDSSSLGFSGQIVLTLVGSNTWCASYAGQYASNAASFGGGNLVLGGTLDRLRFTTVNGTDTFDAGLINILYE
jgi:hypothetical protein